MAVLEQAIQEKELEQLVSLAETVSEKIEGLKKSYNQKDNENTVVAQFSISLLIAVGVLLGLYYYSFEIGLTYKIYLSTIVVAGVLIALLLYLIFRNKNASRNKRNIMTVEIAQEQKILTELLNMIHSYKELAYQDMSVVSRAVFEMRLSRIAFSVDKKKDEQPSFNVMSLFRPYYES